MSKRILYLEDLYDFYSNYKKSTHYSVDEKHQPIVVQTKGKLKFNEDGSKDDLTLVHLQACHTEKNRNQSYISEETMSKALSSFSNRPILGYIHYVDDKPCFKSHTMHEENGEIVYDEFPVGVIPESCNAQIVYDKEKDKSYVEVDGYIFDEYSKAKEILEREQELDVSVELSIRELSYSSKEKCLEIEDFYFSGVTILQCDEEGNKINPGMAGSNIKLADFSADNNSLFADKIDSLQEKLDLLLSRFDIDETYRKEDGEVTTETMEEVVETTEVIDEIIETDDTEDSNFDDTTEDETNSTESEETDDETPAEEESDAGEEEVDDTDDEPTEDTSIEDVEDNACGGGGSGSGSAKKKKKHSKEEAFDVIFEISFGEIEYALNALCSVFRNDDEWCYVSQVFDDYFIMKDWDSEKYYKQSYTRDEDNITFVGERISMFAMLLTESEKNAIDEMRSNYAELVEYKTNAETNELNSKRDDILNNEKYAGVSNVDAFKELVKNKENYSLEELEKEAKIIFADNVDISEFSAEKKTSVKKFGDVNKKVKQSRYGNLFKK